MDEYDHEEIPNHHLPRMSDLENPSGHHHSHPKMSDLDNHSGHHNHRKMSDLNNPSGHHNNNYGPPPPRHGKPVQFHSPPGPVDGLPLPHGKRRRHNHSPPPPPYGHSSSKAGAFASIATLLLLLALTAFILYLVYRPNTPHFSIVAASIYLLNATTAAPTPFGPPPLPTATFLATSMQFTVVTRNSHHRTSLYYDHLTAQVYYRDQPITTPTDLPPLFHVHRTTVVFSPVLGGGAAVPVAPGVVEGLMADENYGMMGLRVVVTGRVQYKVGIIWTAHYGVYVGCDLLLGVKKAVVGPVTLLANHDCKVEM